MSSPGNIYVAVVEDDIHLSRSFGRLLRATGYQPITYPSAEAFLEDRKQPHFDCLVLNTQLGGLSGVELKRRLDAAGSVVPVIFITSGDDLDGRKRAIAAGCVGCFRATDAGSEVIDAIGRAVARPESSATPPGGGS